MAVSLVTVGFASQDFKTDVVLIVGGENPGPENPENPEKPGGNICQCKPGDDCNCNPDENGNCDCLDPEKGCQCKPGTGNKPDTNPDKKPCQCKPGSDCNCKPDGDGNCDCQDPDKGCDCKPGTGNKPGPGDGDGSGTKPKPNPGDDDNKPSKPSKPNRPSRPSGGGGSSKPSVKPNNKPSQNPNENKPKGEQAGGWDSDGNPYYLISGVQVDNRFREEGYMYGFKNYVFGAEDYLTRAQFAAIMDRVFVFENQKITKSFDDTRGNWAEDSINRLASNGIILGVSDTEFRPNDALTRGHVLLMLTRVLNTTDYSKIARWDSVKAYHASETVSKLLNSGIYDDMGKNFDINARITRAEMVHLMNNIIYARNVKDVETENFVLLHGMYRDLTSDKNYKYYDDCIKALNYPFVVNQYNTRTAASGLV